MKKSDIYRLAAALRLHVCNSLNMEYYPRLNGACAIASEALVRLYKLHGIHSTFIEGIYVPEFDEEFDEDSNHCWVVINDQIIDITASQFWLDSIHITSVYDEDYREVRRGQEAINFCKKEWPADQKPWGRKMNVNHLKISNRNEKR